MKILKKTYFAFTFGQTCCLLLPSFHNETSLLRQVAEGHEQAFAELFHRYHHKLGAYIYDLTSSREMAEEVVQDVFMKVWHNRAELTEIKHFKTWLYTVSKNHALNARRDSLRKKLRHKAWEQNQYPDIPPEELGREEQFELIEQAVNQLSPQQKKVFIMSRYQRLKYDEIARELNISRETVKSYLQVAIATIRKFVHGRIMLIIGLLLSLLL